MRNIIIIGAGPAGALPAKLLSDAGYSVLLFDHRAPWEKPCGGILGPDIPEDMLNMNTFAYPINTYPGIHYESPRKEEKFIKTGKPFSVVSRRHLGNHLLDRAIEAGTDFRREKVLSLEYKNQNWQVNTGGKTYSADIIIGADGATGITRKNVSRPFGKKNLNQSCGYFMKGIPKDICIMKFLDIQGYLWIVSCPSHTSAGILAKFGTVKGNELFQRLDNFLAEKFPDAEIIEPYAALIPAFEDKESFDEPCCGKNWLLTGDAAGHNNPVLGEGIYYALESGRLAAEAIISRDIQSYENRWREAYGRQLCQAAEYNNKLSKTVKVFGNEMAGAMLYKYFTSG